MTIISYTLYDLTRSQLIQPKIKSKNSFRVDIFYGILFPEISLLIVFANPSAIHRSKIKFICTPFCKHHYS